MILPGLCSVTFRKLSVAEIVALAAANGLRALEWGGDIHVPAGKLDVADDVRRQCADAGLRTPSYGSYFRVTPESKVAEFRPILETAQALGAATIRVWAGTKPSRDMDNDYFRGMTDAARALCEEAAGAGCRLGFEYHLDTATDTNETASRLIEETAHPAATLYWQPRQKTPFADRLDGLRQIRPHLAHLHVFQWVGERDTRLPLAEGAEDWKQYLACASAAGGEWCAYLEFVPDDSVESFVRDAATLCGWLADGQPAS